MSRTSNICNTLPKLTLLLRFCSSDVCEINNLIRLKGVVLLDSHYCHGHTCSHNLLSLCWVSTTVLGDVDVEAWGSPYTVSRLSQHPRIANMPQAVNLYVHTPHTHALEQIIRSIRRWNIQRVATAFHGLKEPWNVQRQTLCGELVVCFYWQYKWTKSWS